jgi:ADP-ribose pyrophosphatase
MKILRKEIIAETVPVNLVRSSFEDKAGNINHWVYVERAKRQFAVFVVGVHYNLPGSQPAIILNKEYRVPIGGYVYDLPAGLAEINENPTDAAKREFLEETGYGLDVTYVSPRNFSSPGITNEFSYVVYGIASGDGSKHSREDSEDITTYAITREKAQQILDNPNLNLGTKALMVLHQFARTGTV